MAQEEKTSKRKEAAKELGKTQIQGMKDSAKGIVDTAKGFVSGGVLGAAKSAAGAVGNLVKDNYNLFKNLFKVIFNDAEIYGGDASLPVNEVRPMGMQFYKGVADNSVSGFIPKLSELYVKMFRFHESDRYRDNIQSLYEDMRLALRSNLTYSIEDVSRFVLNNISLYIVCKYYEKRLGFIKYEDPQFADFHNLWKTNEIRGTGYNIIRELSINSDFSAESNLANTLDVYAELVQSSFRFVLPVNMKTWIDHYIGSLFVLDDDVANPKYLSIVPCDIQYFNKDNTISPITVNGLTIDEVKRLVNDFRYDSTYATIRADIIKIPMLSDSKAVKFEFSEGWLTPYEEYVPTPIIDPSMKQALINGYTTNTHLKNNFIRIDTLPNNGHDDLTTILFMGATYNTTDQAGAFKAYGLEVEKLAVKVYAAADNVVELAPGMVQSGSDTFTDPFALTLTSEVSSDVYVSAETPTQGRIYYPNGADYATGTLHVVNFATDPYQVRWYDMDNGMNDAYLAIPISQNASGSYLFLVTVTKLTRFETRNINAGNLTKVYYVNANDVNPLSPLGKSIRDHAPLLLSSLSVFAGEAGESFGRTGNILVERQGFSTFVSINIDNAALQAASESPINFTWITSSLWPNADLSTQYVVGTVVDHRLVSRAGYIYYPQWIFTSLGYCIPVYNSLKVHMNIGNSNTMLTLNDSLLKEDYIPMIINVQDCPAIMSRMLAGLTKFHK